MLNSINIEDLTEFYKLNILDFEYLKDINIKEGDIIATITLSGSSPEKTNSKIKYKNKSLCLNFYRTIKRETKVPKNPYRNIYQKYQFNDLVTIKKFNLDDEVFVLKIENKELLDYIDSKFMLHSMLTII
jgi:hypothetical protein